MTILHVFGFFAASCEAAFYFSFAKLVQAAFCKYQSYLLIPAEISKGLPHFVLHAR